MQGTQTILFRATVVAGSMMLVAATATAAAQAATANDVRPANCAQSAGAPSVPYLISSQATFISLLPPPPAPDSNAERQDLAAVLTAQRAARASHTTSQAIADADANCGRFEDVLGSGLKDPSAGKTLAFLNKAAGETSAAMAGPAKRYWRRARPYVLSADVERLADVAPHYERPKPKVDPACEPQVPRNPGKAALTAAKAKADKDKADKDKGEVENAWLSYPSGHSTYFTACAILLAEMVPEKRTELFNRGRELGMQRLIVGAHYPTDVEAGNYAGSIGIALMATNPTFQHDFQEARAPLRAALGLSAEPPDLKTAKPKALEDAEKALEAAQQAVRNQ